MSRIGDLVRDSDYPDAMWRVVMPDGDLSDMINWDRARELARLLVLEQRVKQRGTAA